MVGAVVGGLSTLTICLAAALIFAVARIYGWRLFGRRGGKGGSRRSDVESVLQMEREATLGAVPSIVTTRLVDSPAATSLESSQAAEATRTDASMVRGWLIQSSCGGAGRCRGIQCWPAAALGRAASCRGAFRCSAAPPLLLRR